MKLAHAQAQLFQAPHHDFVATRKRLAAELKTAGHKDDAAAFAKTARPPISAWAINQLWWRHEAAFTAFLESAKSIRTGKLEAVAEHRAQQAALVKLAKSVLEGEGNAAAETTLRRIETTLSALAATGGFDPEPDGMLTDDREASGFSALGISSLPGPAPEPSPPSPVSTDDVAEQQAMEQALAEAAKRDELEAKSRAKAQALKKAAQAEVERLRSEVQRLEAELEVALSQLNSAEQRLAALDT